MSTSPHIVVTGMGACSALGADVPAHRDALRNAREGIRPAANYTGINGKPAWAGMAPLSDDAPWPPGSADSNLATATVDRTARLAYQATAEALTDAGLSAPLGSTAPDPARVGLVIGTSHGGRRQIDTCVTTDCWDDEGAERIVDTAAHHAQTILVARAVDARGPVLTVSSACSSGGNAIGAAFDLLHAGKADIVAAGGADAFSKLTLTGFDALGATADGRCSPFSTGTGMTLGEGSGIVVLETAEHAAARGADPHAILRGYGLSWDAYHQTRPHPNGDGLGRALRRALHQAGLGPESLDYVNLHGTGTSANDASETRGIQQVYEEHETEPPPGSSLKAQTGHTLGAAAALGFVASILGMEEEILPPTLHFEEHRPGCTLDYIPNEPREAPITHFGSNSAAFGGVNCVLVGSDPDSTAGEDPRSALGRIGVTGIGLVSPVGHTTDAFARALQSGDTGIRPPHDEANDLDAPLAPVTDFSVRALMPHLRVRRQNPVIKYASVAAGLALEDAGHEPAVHQEEVGLVVGTTRGAVKSYEKFIHSVEGRHWERASASAFTKLVMSSIGGFVSQAHKLEGVASTVVAGTTSGLPALAHGTEMLRRNPDMSAVVVVAADEVSPFYHDLIGKRGRLTDGPLRPYADDADGTVLGEGAAAVVLERLSDPTGDGAPGSCYAGISGYGQTCDAGTGLVPDPVGDGMARALQQAMNEAGGDRPDFLYGHGCGLGADARELKALRETGWTDVPVGCVNGNLGTAEAASGLFSVAAALLSLTRDEVFPVRAPNGTLPNDVDFVTGASRPGRYSRAVVLGGTEYGSNTAVVLDRPAQ